MTDERPQASNQQDDQTNPPEPPSSQTPVLLPEHSQPKKSNKKTWWIVGGTVAFLFFCSILCVVVFGTRFYRVIEERAPVEAVLDAYMQHMAKRDAESAYALFSPRAQRLVSLTELQELLEGNNFVIFEGYQSLSINTLSISTVANINPDIPQGTVARVTGDVMYENDVQGSFESVLEKVSEKWMMDGMYVVVPPSKIK